MNLYKQSTRATHTRGRLEMLLCFNLIRSSWKRQTKALPAEVAMMPCVMLSPGYMYEEWQRKFSRKKKRRSEKSCYCPSFCFIQSLCEQKD